MYVFREHCLMLLNASPLPQPCPEFCDILHSYVRVQQTGDPSYSTYDDLSTYTSVKVRVRLEAVCLWKWVRHDDSSRSLVLQCLEPKYNACKSEYSTQLVMTRIASKVNVGLRYWRFTIHSTNSRALSPPTEWSNLSIFVARNR